MEKKEAAEVEEQTRIYVGGLGEKVTNDDVAKIFSSLGKVKAVDIVRTKGRSFCYVDFFPSSDKSLSKLFSTYNGCVWKGGRLRLEKAKEHYLARLKREWAEDAEIESCPVSDCVEADREVAAPLEKPKKVLDKEKKLNIFFPRLRKVKTLPFSGTGKHKYSFQRVEAPPIPMYFCDCEEHSAAFCAVERKQICHHASGEGEIRDLEALGGVINEEELNLMNSVMNKLFERENVSNAGYSGTKLASDEHRSGKMTGDLHIGEDEEDSVADEDNLVINALSRGNNRMALSRCQEKIISPNNKKLTLDDTRTTKDRLASVPKEQKKNNLFLDKKRKSQLNDETIGNEFMAANPGDNMNLQTKTNKLRTRLGAQHAESESGVKQSTASHSWSQKMSWKALVGDKDNRVFSVSNILPVNASTEEADNGMDSFEELKFDENESDEDNLVINVVSKKKTKMALSRRQEQETTSTMNQKPIFDENKTSKDRPIQQIKSTPPPKKKRKSVIDEENERNKSLHTVPESAGSAQTHTNETLKAAGAQPIEPESGVKQYVTDHSESIKSSRRVLVGDKDFDESNISNILQDNAKEEQSVSDGADVPGSADRKNQNLSRNENLKSKLPETESLEVLAEAQPSKSEVLAEAQPSKSNTVTNKSGKVSSWFQKSPWTQLVNESNSSFSITQISPGITFKKHEVSEPNGGKDIPNPNDKKFSKSVSQATSEPIICGFTAPKDGKEGDVVLQSIPEKNQSTVVGNNEASASIVANKYDSTPRQTTNGEVAIGETCSFMRSAASIKEWSSAKAALSGSQSHKRKGREK